MAGTLTIDTLKASSGVLATQNGMNGIAKAWVNFNPTTSPVTINSSFNVSSVTVSATGVYAVNFSTAMPSALYNYIAMSQMPTDTGIAVTYIPPPSLGTNTANTALIRTAYQNGSTTAALTPSAVTSAFWI